MSENNDLVLLSIDGPVATLTINRPDRLNALDRATVDALWVRLVEAARDPDVRAVVLTGAGRAFCAGGDLPAALAVNPDRPGHSFLSLAAILHQCVLELRTMPKPVVAAVNGPAAGAGFSLALACDLRVMAESAFMQQAYTSVGLCIDGAGTFTLPRLVGLAKTLEIAMLDERIPAPRALELGLVNRLAPDAQVLDEASQLAQELATKAVRSLGRAKQLLNRSFDTSLEKQLEDERHTLAACADDPEGREGIAAFIQKRKPNFPAAKDA